jgi:hypothetical protein
VKQLRVFACFLLTWILPGMGTVSAGDMSPAQIKSKIVAFGSKPKAEVQVKLKNGTILRGRILQPGDADFILQTRERAQVYAYEAVSEVK